MSNKLKEICFGQFRYSFPQGCLFRGDQLVSLTGKEREILAALLESGSQLVQKTKLCERLWPDKQVEASNLFHHVKSLRDKLGLRDNGQSFIETIPGRGYRLVTLGECEEADQDHEEADQSDQPAETNQPITKSSVLQSHIAVSKRWIWLVAMALLVGIVTVAAILSNRTLGQLDRSPDAAILTGPEKGLFPRLLQLIDVGPQPSNALLVGKRGELFVSDIGGSVSIVDTNRDIVVHRIGVGALPTKLVLAVDGKQIYVAQGGGGVGVIDIAARAFRYASTFRQPVEDIALTPDGKSAYLAAGFLGVAKLDLATESITSISKTVFARAVALTPDGRRLYVSYQAKGPGGSFGHDAIGYFDTTTDQSAGAISGFPNVGECLTVSPDSSQVWENGADACDSPQYDHVGCPFVPGGLLNIISTSNNKVHPVGVRGARLLCPTFSSDGEIVAVGTTDHFMLIRARDLAVIGSLPIGSTGKIAFSNDGLKAYAPVNAKSQLAVIQIGATVRSLRLTNRENNQGTVQLALQSEPDFDAKAIDPTSLRLEGVPAGRAKDGSLAASIERVTGFEGHSLIVRFNLDSANHGAKLTLVGRTYSGVPIRSLIDSF